ncbi:hypothetical protein ACFVIM_28310 [Streptomyces sp. NPDC057638]|uniref:hypothetical protein n=1 Tax=Streptomyces sp. NPDC057638 TaxID=3346190 RepID=UPI0036958D1E
MEPLTESRQVSGPVVFGFLRLVRVSGARKIALETALTDYCRQHELTLSGLFAEDTGPAESAAFTGLMDVLALPGTYGVVLPSASHLGTKTTAAARIKRINASGARLLLIRCATKPSHQPGGHSATLDVLETATALEAET